MSTTRHALANPPRPFRPVTLPGVLSIHVRDLTLAELDAVDAHAEIAPEGPDRNVRRALLLCAFALAEPDGSACYPELAAIVAGDQAGAADAIARILRELAGLTPGQLAAIGDAATTRPADAKNC